MEQVEQHDEYRQDDIAYCSKGFPHVRYAQQSDDRSQITDCHHKEQ